jgi:cyclopropane-fatty-acyl-phospholipid synthase
VSWYLGLAERGVVPDAALRAGIRRRLAAQARELVEGGVEATQERERALLARLASGAVAVDTDTANEQHYELPAAFFRHVLGPHLKYSCAYWPEGVESLEEAEAAMLELYAERAGLADGMRVLDLGCGWGSLSLWLAGRHPRSRITALSNSHGQRAFIEEEARRRGLTNLEVVTLDVNDLVTRGEGGADAGRPPLPAELAGPFDRVVSIEMFEHVRNHRPLLARIAERLAPDGRLFVHIFTHRVATYTFDPAGPDDWMARYFFTGGIMPSDRLLLHHQQELVLLDHWHVSGRHYQRTADAWLDRMDAARAVIEPIFREVYRDDAATWWVRWRLFFMACAELWGFDGGDEWLVSHYLFAPRAAGGPRAEEAPGPRSVSRG